jgi:phosphate starvation-inducible PhoH-like protein
LNELIIELEEISPKEFFGAQNSNIELLKKYFPKLKIVARGNKLTAFGDEELLEEFDRRLTMLLAHFGKYNMLDENVIERVLTSQSSDDYQTSEASGAVLVHGVGGKLIKAQTANQRKLVDSMRKNDMVFAIGPAGTGKTYTGVALAVQALKNKEVKRIILTRPAVEAGENLGFFQVI